MENQGQNIGDRRPIASRELAIWKQTAHWLATRRVSANAISVIGMIGGLGAGVAFSLTDAWPALARLWWLIAAGLILFRLMCNMLDGMVAVETGTDSPVGELYNEVPDRISDSATLIGLGYATGSVPALGYVAALAAVFTAYIRAVGKVAGAPQDYGGPMAKQQRMFTAAAVGLFCGLSPTSWQGPWGDSLAWGLPAWALLLVVVGAIITSLQRLLRAAVVLKRGRR